MTSHRRGNGRRQGVVFALVTLLALGVAVGYSLHVARRDVGQERAAAAEPVRHRAMPTGPRIVFVDTGFGRDTGKVAAVPLARPGGPRAVTGTRCQRVYATARAGVCLVVERGLLTRYRARLLDGSLAPVGEYAVTGQPSRARMSRDSRFAATTVFVGGHSYAETSFSTATTVYDVAAGRSLGNLEDFAFYREGKRYRSPDLNVWGVTFAADGRRFFATVSAGGRIDLVRGDLVRRELRSVRRHAECPSLSPDERHLVYKVQVGEAEGPVWRLHVLDLATGRETPLGERRNIDDQVEWLDNGHVLYGVGQVGLLTGGSDIWSAPIDGGRPRLLIPRAASPAVIR